MCTLNKDAVNRFWYYSDYPGAPTTPKTFIGGGAGGGFGNQTEWLERDLRKAILRRCRPGQERGCYNWIIVFGHRPMYSSRVKNEDWPIGTAEKFQKHFEPLFSKYGVDLYIGAHIHNYERVGSVKEGIKCPLELVNTDSNEAYYRNPSCTVHITNGAGGNCEGVDPQGPNKRRVDHTVSKAGFATFKVFNSTHLNWKYYSSESTQPELEDSVWIVKTKVTDLMSKNEYLISSLAN